MLLKDVQRKVLVIQRLGKVDPEAAHVWEDLLYIDVLKHVVEHSASCGRLAEAALEASELDFPRWCA